MPTENDEGDLLPDFSLDANNEEKYKNSISHILSKQCSEIKSTIEETAIQPLQNMSRRRLRELISKQNNETLAFLSRPDKTPNVLGFADMIFRKYGHEPPTFKLAKTSITTDLNLDTTIDKSVADFDEGLKKINGTGFNDFLVQIRWIFNMYKSLGEEVLRLEAILTQKAEMLDRLNNRLPLITGLGTNDALPGLLDAFSKYAEEVYQSSKMEDTYKELIEVYKKWHLCREIISLQNFVKDESHEPICPICLTDPITQAVIPCGHTFCSNCSKKLNMSCSICRGIVRERIRLYFS